MQNPTKSSPPNLGLDDGQKVEYPKELLKEFEGTPGGYAWISPKNPALLDYEGAEFILIGGNPDLGTCFLIPSPLQLALMAFSRKTAAHIVLSALAMIGAENAPCWTLRASEFIVIGANPDLIMCSPL